MSDKENQELNLDDILREFGATHIVITEYFTPDWELSAGYTNLIFENDSIRIYEIII